MENSKFSGSLKDSRLSIPLNPLIHPSNEVDVFEVYVIISSFIFKSPYESGQPEVDATRIDVSKVKISEDRVVCSVKSTLLNFLKFLYFVIFVRISMAPD